VTPVGPPDTPPHWLVRQLKVNQSCRRFGVFEVNLAARELRKHGLRVHLPGQPFAVLALLLEKPGEVITREELQRSLWPADTFVDFEHGLNSAIKKLRAALCDSPENSRYIETIPRVGYRFVAPVESIAQDLPSVDAGAMQPRLATVPVPETAKPRRRLALWAGTGTAIAAGVLLFLWILPARLPHVLRVTQLTHSGRVDPYAMLVSDGARLYYLERNGGHWDTMQISVSGGQPQRLSFPFANTQILDVSPDLSEFLVGSFVDTGHHAPIWRVPILGGTPRRVGEILARDALWFPDGRRLLFSDATRLFSSDPEGKDIRTLAEVPGYISRPAWSEGGQELKFELHDLKTDLSSVWEIRTDGTRLRRMRLPWPNSEESCCARWMPDGRYLVFSSPPTLGEGALWALHRKQLFLMPSQPVQLTTGPQTCYSPLPSRDGKKLYAYCLQIRYETVQQDPTSRLFRPYLPVLKAAGFEYSRDGLRIVYATWSDSTIWFAQSDGSHPRQVTFPPLAALRPSWSPDGKSIAFTARRPGEPYRSYLVSAEGGTPVPLPHIGPSQWNPQWSPDGASIVFQAFPLEGDASSPESGLYLLEVSSGKTTKIEGSEGYDYPHWSRDGRFIAAIGKEAKKILLYDLPARKWSSIAEGVFLSGLSWSADSKWIYYQDLLEEGEPVYRVSPDATRRKRIADFRVELKEGYQRCGFLGLTPDGAPVAILRANYADIYAFDVDFP
jgi:Tol biopolymer transport system component/DNA-binding winged helix-turn-helix (wHTH) protein